MNDKRYKPLKLEAKVTEEVGYVLDVWNLLDKQGYWENVRYDGLKLFPCCSPDSRDKTHFLEGEEICGVIYKVCDMFNPENRYSHKLFIQGIATQDAVKELLFKLPMFHPVEETTTSELVE